MLDDYKDVLTVNDLYEILPIGRNKIYDLIHSGNIESIYIAGKYLISKKSLLEFLKSA